MPAYTIQKTTAASTSPDKQYPSPVGPGLSPTNSWNGSLTDPNGLAAWLAGEYFTESTDNWQSPPLGGFGMESWSSWAAQAGYAGYANDAVYTVKYDIQAAVAGYFGDQYFKTYGNWASVAAAWSAGPGVINQGLNGPAAQFFYNNNGITVQDYINRVVQHMNENSGATIQTPAATTPSAGAVFTPTGALVNSPEPVNNTTFVQPGPPMSLEYFYINGVPLALTQYGEVSLLDLISDCTVDMTATQLSTLTLTFQQGDIVLNALNLGIGNVTTPVVAAFCDSKGNTLWPFVVTSVQETSNAAQQPAITVTCTSKLLQQWQGIFPPTGKPAGSPTSWLMSLAQTVMGISQYPDGRWVFAGQRTRSDDPSFIVNPASPSSGTLSSSVYDVAQACQQSESYYLFDSKGTTWFGEPSWITTKTQTALIYYAPAGEAPYDGTGTIPIISPVGPPQCSMVIQTVPSGFTLIQSRKIVRTVTVALPQYYAAQMGPGFHVMLAGVGAQYDTSPISDPFWSNLGANAPASTSLSLQIGPAFPYIVTEVTGTIDGGLTTWNVTFQEAILPSQTQTPGSTVNPSTTPMIGSGTTTWTIAPPQQLINPYTQATLSPSGTKSKLASDFVGYAEAFIGQQYIWGDGHILGPNNVAVIGPVDCSGLVVSALDLAGIFWPGNSDSMYQNCTKISIQQAFNTPGALLFANFGEDGDPTLPGHVMICAGDGHGIEAAHSNSTVAYVTLALQANAIVETQGNGVGGQFVAAGLVPGLTYDMGINGQGAAPLPTTTPSPDSTTKTGTVTVPPPKPYTS